jgi:hypothetical protein
MASIVRQIYTSAGYGKKNSPARRTVGQLYDRRGGGTNADMYPERYATHPRSAWIVTCRNWLSRPESSVRFIPLFVNPSDVNWSLPKRGTVVKTAAGAVRNTWRNRYRNTYFDEFTLNVTFQSGNIMPSQGNVGANLSSIGGFSTATENPGVPPGLLNFYRFLELTDQPKLLGSWENRHIIIYHSRIFPVLRLEGFFTEDPITWADTVNDGNKLSWTATFQVYKTFPKISVASLLERTYRTWVREDVLAEAFPLHQLRTMELLEEARATLPKSSGNRPPATTLETRNEAARLIEEEFTRLEGLDTLGPI